MLSLSLAFFFIGRSIGIGHQDRAKGSHVTEHLCALLNCLIILKPFWLLLGQVTEKEDHSTIALCRPAVTVVLHTARDTLSIHKCHQGQYIYIYIYRPLCPVFPGWTMTEAQGHSPKSSWGLELRSGHLHKDRHGRSPAPSASHRPVRQKRRAHSASSDSSHASSSAQQSIPKWAGVPAVPQLRALEAQAAAIPISSSAASSASPRSGSSRVHPYPVGEAFEGSPFELVPSMATQAAQSSVQGGSMESTPVAEVAISPTTPPKPIQMP